MAKVIPFADRSDQPASGGGLLEFRPLPWESLIPAMVGRAEAERYERRRVESLAAGQAAGFVPAFLALRGSLGLTLGHLFAARSDEARLRRIYYLGGLLELAIRHPHALLRTDLVRRLFETILSLAEDLAVAWPVTAEGFLLPLPERLYPVEGFAQRLQAATTFKDLLAAVKVEVDLQLDLVGTNFVFYVPAGWWADSSEMT